MSHLLLCTDLDRTLLPNGAEPESPQARAKFHQLISHPQVTLAYVTGRHQQLVEQAIVDYQLPHADYVIADVGSSIYKTNNTSWEAIDAWKARINNDWQGKEPQELANILANIEHIQLQEASKQNIHKLSYYLDLNVDSQAVISAIKHQLDQHSIASNLIWSIDDQANVGLLDILPISAGKRQAIEFLMEQLNCNYSNTIFAGDSGNDICVMSSPIQSVLVANATEDVRQAARQRAEASHQQNTLYFARGFMGMNGNYSAGILEGVAHYMPQAAQWFRGET